MTHASLAAKYDIFRMENPSHADTVLLGREADQITTYGAYLRDKTTANGELPPEKRYDLRLSAEEVCIKFNLAWPIVAQWKRFKPLLGVCRPTSNANTQNGL